MNLRGYTADHRFQVSPVPSKDDTGAAALIKSNQSVREKTKITLPALQRSGKDGREEAHGQNSAIFSTHSRERGVHNLQTTRSMEDWPSGQEAIHHG